MQGRIENERSIHRTIEKMLENLPPYVEEWYDTLAASYKTAATCREYITKVTRYLSSIDSDTKAVTVDRLTKRSVEKYFKDLQYKTGKDEQTSHSYRQLNYTVISHFLRFLVNRGYLKTDPFEESGIQIDKNRDVVKRIQLTSDDFIAILNAAGRNKNDIKRRRDTAILCIFMTTGIRETALRNIDVEDIDFDSAILYVVDKGDKPIEYNLNAKTMDAINSWMKIRYKYNGHGLKCLFLSQKQTRMTPTAVAQVVRKYSAEGLGYKISPHKLRAGFCSIIYNETGNIEFVRRAVGHSNVTTTQKYIVTDGKEREKAAEIMGGLLE